MADTKYKIVWNKDNFIFQNCKIEEQFLSHSKDKIEELFNEVIEVNYKDKQYNKHTAENILYYKIMCLFGSSQVNFFKIQEVKKRKDKNVKQY